MSTENHKDDFMGNKVGGYPVLGEDLKIPSNSYEAGDYFEIKAVNPTWATNPLTTIFGGYILIEI